MQTSPSNNEEALRNETARDRIRRLQFEWAEQRGIAVDALGNVSNYQKNLRISLSDRALKAFSRGEGSEIRDAANGSPAKMRSVYASSALAVNVFDYWLRRDAGPLFHALGVDGSAASLAFEAPLRSAFGGVSPLIDMLIHLEGGGLVGIESKFTEWMSKKSKQAEKLSPYFSPDGASFWSRAGLSGAHQLAKAIVDKTETFDVLDVPQLLKHILGLRAAAGDKPWGLRYVYFASADAIAEAHDVEIARLQVAIGNEVRFSAMTYQALFASIANLSDNIDAEYLGYLRERYFVHSLA